MVVTIGLGAMLAAVTLEFVGLLSNRQSDSDVAQVTAPSPAGIGGALVAASTLIALVIALVWSVEVVAVVLVIAVTAGGTASLIATGAARFWRAPATRTWRIACAAFGVVVFGFAAVTLYLPAVEGPDNALAGHGLSGLDRVILPWDATVAEIEWTGGSVPPQAIDKLKCGIYLGTSGATVVIVDPARRSVLRVPAGNVVIRTHTANDGREPVCGQAGVEYEASRSGEQR